MPYTAMKSRSADNRDPSAANLETGSDVVEFEYREVRYKDWFTKKRYIPWWILLVVIAVLVVLMTVYHRQIVDWLRPVSAKIRSLSWGWVIPILVLILISFPPLFGHEIVAVLCGVVYGLWIGFGIVAAGTFFGEILTYFAFKYVLRRRAEKLEKTNLNYGALARITREGGFWIVFLIRLSIIPSHFSTAVFATCGVSFWAFLIATFVTLPKQLVIVYLGVILTNTGKGRLISDVVLGITFLLTVFAGLYIYWKMRKIRPVLLEEQEARRSAKQQLLQRAESNPVERETSYEQAQFTHIDKDYEAGNVRHPQYELDTQPQAYHHQPPQYHPQQAGHSHDQYEMDAHSQPYRPQDTEYRPQQMGGRGYYDSNNYRF